MRRAVAAITLAVALAAGGTEPSDGGEDARAFDTIAEAVGTRPREELLREMEAWLAAHPQHPLVPRGLYWMGKQLGWSGDVPGALAYFHRVVAEYPGTQWALDSELNLANQDSLDGNYSQALKALARLAKMGDAGWRSQVRRAYQDTLARQRRDYVMMALAAGLLLFAGWRVVATLRRRAPLWPPPEELTFVLPLLAVLLLSSLRLDPASRRAMRSLMLGGAALLWINGAFLRSRPPVRAARLREGALGLVQAAALFYCAVVDANIWEHLVETLQTGPE